MGLTLLYVPWRSSLPRPRPPSTRAPKKNHPSTNPVQRTPAKDSHPEPTIDPTLAPSRTHISSPLAIAPAQRPWRAPNRMWLTSSENPAPTKGHKTSKSKHSHTKSNRDTCPTQWTRTIRSLAPVRGLTRPSIPPPFHWREEKCPETSSREPWNFFFFFKSAGPVPSFCFVTQAGGRVSSYFRQGELG